MLVNGGRSGRILTFGRSAIFLFHCSSIVAPTKAEFTNDFSDSCIGVCNPKSPHLGQYLSLSTMAQILMHMPEKEYGNVLVFGENEWMLGFLDLCSIFL